MQVKLVISDAQERSILGVDNIFAGQIPFSPDCIRVQMDGIECKKGIARSTQETKAPTDGNHCPTTGIADSPVSHVDAGGALVAGDCHSIASKQNDTDKLMEVTLSQAVARMDELEKVDISPVTYNLSLDLVQLSKKDNYMVVQGRLKVQMGGAKTVSRKLPSLLRRRSLP